MGLRGDTMKWKTRGGEEIEISDMSTEHIRNCIRFMERNEDVYKERLERIEDEYESTLGWISPESTAWYTIDSVLFGANDKDRAWMPDAYWEMIEELERRGGNNG